MVNTVPSESTLWGQLDAEIRRALGELAPTRAKVTAVSGGLVAVSDVAGRSRGVLAQLEGWRELAVGDEVLLLEIPARGQQGDIRPGSTRIVLGAIQRQPARGYPTRRGLVVDQGPAGPAGQLYFPTNSLYVARSNGTSWEYAAPLFPVKAVPALTPFNVGSATLTQRGGLATIQAPNIGTANNLAMWYRSSNPTGQTLTVAMLPLMSTKNYHACGLFFRDNAGSKKLITFGPSFGGTIAVNRWTNGSTFNATAFTMPVAAWPLWYRMTDIAGTLSFQLSSDGQTWTVVYAEARSTFLGTEDIHGVFVNPVNQATPNLDLQLALLSWED